MSKTYCNCLKRFIGQDYKTELTAETCALLLGLLIGIVVDVALTENYDLDNKYNFPLTSIAAALAGSFGFVVTYIMIHVIANRCCKTAQNHTNSDPRYTSTSPSVRLLLIREIPAIIIGIGIGWLSDTLVENRYPRFKVVGDAPVSALVAAGARTISAFLINRAVNFLGCGHKKQVRGEETRTLLTDDGNSLRIGYSNSINFEAK